MGWGGGSAVVGMLMGEETLQQVVKKRSWDEQNLHGIFDGSLFRILYASLILYSHKYLMKHSLVCYSLRTGYVFLEIKQNAESDLKADTLCAIRDCPGTVSHTFVYKVFHTYCTTRGFLILFLFGLWCVFRFYILIFILGIYF